MDVITDLNFHHCFANAGTMAVTINNVVRVNAGNNVASYVRRGLTITLCRYCHSTETPAVTVTRVTIY